MKKNLLQNKTEYNIILVEDHPIFRFGLMQLINDEDDLNVCGESEDIHTAFKLIKNIKPDLVILDIGLEGANGVELLKDISKFNKKLPVLVLSMHEESLYAEKVLRLGAKGYIMKQETYRSVIKAIRIVLSGKIYTSEKIFEKLIGNMVSGSTDSNSSNMEDLSVRELEVFQYIGSGHSTKKISQIMNVSITTVSSYRERIKIKLNLNDSTELVQQAVYWVEIENQ